MSATQQSPPRVGGGRDPSDVALMVAIDRNERQALLLAFRRHGAVALAVAGALTRNPARADQAVVAAFVALAVEGRPGPARPLRVEVLDAVRRSARADQPSEQPDRLGPAGAGDVFHTVAPEVREVLALGVSGRCDCAEIAAVLGMDHGTVRRHLLMGLREARALLGSPDRWRSSPPSRR